MRAIAYFYLYVLYGLGGETDGVGVAGGYGEAFCQSFCWKVTDMGALLGGSLDGVGEGFVFGYHHEALMVIGIQADGTFAVAEGQALELIEILEGLVQGEVYPCVLWGAQLDGGYGHRASRFKAEGRRGPVIVSSAEVCFRSCLIVGGEGIGSRRNNATVIPKGNLLADAVTLCVSTF